MFNIEDKYFNEKYITDGKEWIKNSWWLSIIYTKIYLILIYAGKKYMKNRKAFNVRYILFLWNMSLALFSIIGCIRILPEFIKVIKSKGIEHSYCSDDYAYGVSACWFYLFIMSKVVELGDTLFIVLRKQKLIFLHWYHHATVLIYSWYSASEINSTARWFIVMNYCIHAFMYTYYMLKSIKINLHKSIMIILTSLQILQMVIGVIINILALIRKYNYSNKIINQDCNVSYFNISMSLLIYLSYFLLFMYFFYKTYIIPCKNKTIKK